LEIFNEIYTAFQLHTGYLSRRVYSPVIMKLINEPRPNKSSLTADGSFQSKLSYKNLGPAIADSSEPDTVAPPKPETLKLR
jgi:hypothetical protein